MYNVYNRDFDVGDGRVGLMLDLITDTKKEE